MIRAQIRGLPSYSSEAGIIVTGRNDAAVDARNIKAAIPRAQATGRPIYLAGNFKLRFNQTPSFYFSDRASYAAHVAVDIAGNDVHFIGGNITFEAPSYSYGSSERFIGFGTAYNLSPDAQKRISFTGTVFDFTEDPTAPLPIWCQAIKVSGTRGVRMQDCKFWTSPKTVDVVVTVDGSNQAVVTFPSAAVNPFSPSGARGTVIFGSTSDIPELPAGTEVYGRRINSTQVNLSLNDPGDLLTITPGTYNCTVEARRFQGRGLYASNSSMVSLDGVSFSHIRQGCYTHYVDGWSDVNLTFERVNEGCDHDNVLKNAESIGAKFRSMWSEAQPYDLSGVQNMTVSGFSIKDCCTLAYVYNKAVSWPTYAEYKKYGLAFDVSCVNGSPGVLTIAEAADGRLVSGLRLWLEEAVSDTTPTLPTGLLRYVPYIVKNPSGATCNLALPGVITGVTVNAGGTGYTNITLTINTRTGSGATLTGNLSAGALQSVTIGATGPVNNVGGLDYRNVDSVTITGDGTGASVSLTVADGSPIATSGSAMSNTRCIFVPQPELAVNSKNIVIGNGVADLSDNDTNRQSVIVGQERDTRPTVTRSQYYNGCPVLQNVVFHDIAITGGSRFEVGECDGLTISAVTLDGMSPYSGNVAKTGAALSMRASISDANAITQAILRATVRDVRIRNSKGAGFSATGPNSLLVDGLTVEGFNSDLRNDTAYGFRLTDMAAREGATTINGDRLWISGGQSGDTFGAQNLRFLDNGASNFVPVIRFPGTFTSKLGAAPSISGTLYHVFCQIGRFVQPLFVFPIAGVDTTAAATVRRTAGFPSLAEAQVVYGRVFTLDSITGSASNYSSVRIRKLANNGSSGTVSNVSGAVAIDSAAVNAVTYRDMAVVATSLPQSTVVATAEQLLFEFTRTGSGSVLAPITMEVAALQYRVLP